MKVILTNSVRHDRMNSRAFSLIVLMMVIVAALSSTSRSAVAAPITWQSPTLIVSADQALSQDPTIVYAVDWNGSSHSTSVTFDGGKSVTFQVGKINGTGVVGISGAAGIESGRSYTGTTNAAFNSVLNGSAYDGIDAITLTDLTVGTSYLVQIFALDDRGCCTELQTFRDASGNSTAAYSHGANDYVDGTFTADATTETITGVATRSNGSCALNGCSYVNAVVLYDAAAIPEPASLALLATSLAGLGFVSRRFAPSTGQTRVRFGSAD